MSPEPRILIQNNFHMICGWEALLFVVLRAAPTVASMRSMQEELMQRAVRQNDGKVGLMVVVGERMPIPTPEVREVLASPPPGYFERIAAVATVYEGSGFRAATVRSVSLAIRILSKVDHPSEVFSNISTASAWMCDQLRQGGHANLTTQQMTEAVQRMQKLADLPVAAA
ncbi:MAG: hypothetical protein AB2A00_40290 [Myxococcota bacterium]